MLERIGTIRALGVDHGIGARHAAAQFVVIGDDEIQADVARVLRFGNRARAAIHGNRQAHAIRLQFVERPGVQAIAFLKAVRDVDTAVCAQRGQHFLQQRTGRHTIAIVIAVDGDGLTAADGAHDALDRQRHIAQSQWVYLTRVIRQEGVRAVDIPQAPRPQHLGSQRVYAIQCGEEILWRIWHHYPISLVRIWHRRAIDGGERTRRHHSSPALRQAGTKKPAFTRTPFASKAGSHLPGKPEG